MTPEEETLYFLLLIELYIEKKKIHIFDIQLIRQNAAEIAEENYNLYYGINQN